MRHPRFTVQKFEGMIAARGKVLKWERARFCPCYNPASRSSDEDCPLCDGFGYTFTDMGQFTGTILGMAASKSYGRFGEWLAGDALLTYPQDYLLGDRDRITVTEDLYRESDRLQKGLRDHIIEPNVIEIIECVDENRAYTQGIEFNLVGQKIEWNPGMGPADGGTYSVLYTGRPVYVVFQQLPQHRARGKGGREMPRKVALRRWLDMVRPY
jgi:hypothetical protein